MAVYTEVSDEELASFITSYDLGDLLSFKGIAEGVENTNYIVHTSKGPFILTLYEKRVEVADLPFYLGLMEHLAAHGVSCPTPVRNAAGENLSTLSGRPAALVTFLEGFWPRRPTPDHCAAVGRAMATMHLGCEGFTMRRANALGLDGWRPLYDRFKLRASEVSTDLSGLVETELAFLEANWPRDLPEGIIHADLFPDNVFFIGDELSGLIDFYFACNDAFAYDVAVSLNAWCFEKDLSFNITKGRAFLRGYEEVRKLTPTERAALPILARGSAMRFLLTRAYDWLNTPKDALVTPKNPADYIRRLRFHQGVRSIADYGLNGTDK
ncbi:Homoserine kinase [Hyphomicrobium sp. 1Nfss2.1]|uniref:homoserine kinase n=1 Tax=Hyphomicrobium sp. 1Nfss2.1 TaxID=3413936 RepID=UPI003C7E548B